MSQKCSKDKKLRLEGAEVHAWPMMRQTEISDPRLSGYEENIKTGGHRSSYLANGEIDEISEPAWTHESLPLERTFTFTFQIKISCLPIASCASYKHVNKDILYIILETYNNLNTTCLFFRRVGNIDDLFKINKINRFFYLNLILLI